MPVEVYDVFITDPILIDKLVYALWLSGLNENSALLQRVSVQDTSDPLLERRLGRDTVDQYRMFEMLQHYLDHPKLLQTQLLFQIPPQAQEHLIEQYYSFDDTVIRHLLGKKLTTKFRKDLDEISDITSIPLRSCRRQFDNLRRIYSAMEDLNFKGNIYQHLMQQFFISQNLAWRYTCVLFLLHSRFQLHPLSSSAIIPDSLTLRELEFFAGLMMKEWIYPAEVIVATQSHELLRRRSTASLTTLEHHHRPSILTPTHSLGQLSIAHESDSSTAAESDFSEDDGVTGTTSSIVDQMSLETSPENLGSTVITAELAEETKRSYSLIRGVEVDISMSGHLRDIRTHLLNDPNAFDAFKSAVMKQMISKYPNVATFSKFRYEFQHIVKGLLGIGAGLTQSKALKDFFEDIYTLVAEVILSQTELKVVEVDYVFRCIANCLDAADGWYLANDETSCIYLVDWKRFLFVSKVCVIQMIDR